VKRSLTLRREHLAALTTVELAVVNGAAEPTFPVKYCPLMTTQESYLLCTQECMTRGTTCACAGGD
jgi:hypothetical protein